jgi:hypothetical protein
MEIAKGCISVTDPSNKLPFHPMSIPPEAPTDGEKTNLSNFRGAKFLMKARSKCSFLVS